MRSEFLLTNLNELATTGTSSLDNREHFSANLVLELPILTLLVYLEKIKSKCKGFGGYSSIWDLGRTSILFGSYQDTVQVYRMLTSFDSKNTHPGGICVLR